MDDLISRQAAIEAVQNRHMMLSKEKVLLINDLEKLPPAQPKRGRWIPVTNGRNGHECDQCHEYAPSYQTGEEHLSDFCPNCGADMRERKERTVRAIDADALQRAIVEEGQANKRKKYIIGDIWELTGAEIRDVINSQPTIQPEPHWIPVTERLPAMGKSVLMCDIDGDIYLGHRTQCGYYYPDFCGDRVKNVTAWCELPEPYKGVTE